MIRTEPELVGLALALGATDVGPLTRAERSLAAHAASVGGSLCTHARERIAHGDDPLGEAFSSLRRPGARRAQGATYTPPELVSALVGWARGARFARIVDPGAGSARFAVAAGRAFPAAEIVAVEIDPLAALLARAHLHAAGLGHRARVHIGDYRDLVLPALEGPTFFVGNPPYVRHHDIDPRWKRWLSREAARLGLPCSQLAGLHAHFFLATALHGRPGDRGAFVTAAEWLDVNYGALVRGLFLGPLGGIRLDVLEPSSRPFADADTTAVIACFALGEGRSSVPIRRVASLQNLSPLRGGQSVPRSSLAAAARWTPLSRARPKTRSARSQGMIELGELCRVHRGQVTGANAVWIAGAHSKELPRALLFPAVTRARELFAAAPALRDGTTLRQVIDLPAELDALPAKARAAVDRFLRHARAQGADATFVARHRRAWWSVGLREPAPILATYMARRPPAFVRNLALARHINIAHGLYPRERLPAEALDALARYLARTTSTADGRTYAGGLTKFEPREMERLLVPEPSRLLARIESE